MALEITLTNCAPFDGTVTIEDRPLTTGELSVVKRVSGVLPMDFKRHLSGGDPELVVALCVVALIRDGRITRDQAMNVAERILDVGDVTVDSVGGDVIPPAPSGSGNAPDTTKSDSGSSSSTTSDDLANDQSRTGTPGLETGSASDPETSEI